MTDTPRSATLAKRPLGRIGFGCYRVDDRTPAHRTALENALDAGCRLIDTSTNYTDGGSESLVGAVLADRERRMPGARAQVVLVSKIGYVQGQNLDLALERERRGDPFPEMVRYMDGCWHCIHPDFLRDQLRRSLQRLQTERLDVCLLHNPEYFLSDAAHRGAKDREAARAEFYRRVQEAFSFFEEQVAQGVLGAYGVSSNTVVAPGDGWETTSLGRFLDAARGAGGTEHHFRVVQWPMNLFEGGAALEA
ncbi:MAG TPA: aldo/keto reductase, partial [Candidatus Polarisedimenticolia bacterium]|nr:aldo/keto reductase [Candidatus Polarisedimenticolia bacterium]